jgi:hypothetical protein
LFFSHAEKNQRTRYNLGKTMGPSAALTGPLPASFL